MWKSATAFASTAAIAAAIDVSMKKGEPFIVKKNWVKFIR